MTIKIALPKGRLLEKTSALLDSAGWGLSEYHDKARLYRLRSERFPDISAKMFHEKDVPIQVAIGNYDLGVCGLDWVEELLSRYPDSGLVKVRDLGYGRGALLVAACTGTNLESLQSGIGVVRIASEYPNLAESFAHNKRLRRFNIFPLWGAAEVYPPENAELVLLSGKEGQGSFNGLDCLCTLLNHGAFLVANQESWEKKDLSRALASIEEKLSLVCEASEAVGRAKKAICSVDSKASMDTVRLALPDGHQQQHVVKLLNQAGITIDDYPSATGNRRPKIGIEGAAVKVIRPQDMPLQVANGNFDLAITGKDWLLEHRDKFPFSPVTELADLKYGQVKIVAVVSNGLPVKEVYELRQLNAGRDTPFRVASEYVSIADKYARDNQLGMYKVVPTWGASEAFLPEDADLLIENTETGRTIARHNLKIIDTLFESRACLIGNDDSLADATKSSRIEKLVAKLRAAVEA